MQFSSMVSRPHKVYHIPSRKSMKFYGLAGARWSRFYHIEDADGAELAVSLGEQVVGGEPLQVVQVTHKSGFEVVGGQAIVMVSAAQRFGDEFVDQAKRFELAGADAHGLGCLWGEGFVAPENISGGLRRGDGVDSIFHHQDTVGDADGEGAAATPLTDDGGDDGDAQTRHQVEILGDGGGLPAFFVSQRGKSPGSVDQADNRETEFFGLL